MIDPLTLDQMRVLVAVAETGSFSAASRKLGRVQSAISQAIQTMEATLGLPLFDRSSKMPTLTDAGAALVADCKALLVQAGALRARARSISDGVEAELTLAVDAIFPMPVLREGLSALVDAFPGLPATLFTEELGGALETLRAGAARVAICPLPAGAEPDLSVEFLAKIPFAPVVASGHPLAEIEGSLRRETLEPHVQLVLTGRTSYARNLSGGVVGRQIWRFADLATRLDFLLAGFGWCNMPLHMVETDIAAGRLKRLDLADQQTPEFRVFVVHERGRQIGRAARWLIDDLAQRIQRCPRSHFAIVADTLRHS